MCPTWYINWPWSWLGCFVSMLCVCVWSMPVQGKANWARFGCCMPCCRFPHLPACLPHLNWLMEVFSKPVVLVDAQTLAHTKTIFLHPSSLPSAPARSSYQHQKPVVHPGKQLGYLRKNWVMVTQVKLAMGSGACWRFHYYRSTTEPKGLEWTEHWLTWKSHSFPHNFWLSWLWLPCSLLLKQQKKTDSKRSKFSTLLKYIFTHEMLLIKSDH